MPQSLSKVYIHLNFSTNNRQYLIDENIKNSLFEYSRMNLQRFGL